MTKSDSCCSPSVDPPELSAMDLAVARKLLALVLESHEEPLMQAGTLFGDYEILEELGHGGGGVVYRARHAGIHPTVALKLMREFQLASDREIERFRLGATAAAKLDHPHIAPVFHVGDRDGQPFFTMRLLEGGNLERAMPRFRASHQRSAELLAKVARAVHFAHLHHVLHRDLKPANILLDEDDEPYVADFGLAKLLDERDLASRSNAIVGTLDYMSPEQGKAECQLTRAADIYSLGVILYELLTKEVPLPEGSEYEKLRWLTSDAPPRPPRELDPNIDRNLEIICLRCLHKTPQKRYRSAEELANALERAIRPGAGNEPLPPWSQRLEVWARRHPRNASALACLVAVLVVSSLSGWLVWRNEQRALRDTLETNAFIAGGQAGAALAQLREYAERIAQAAHDPELASILGKGEIVVPAPALAVHANGFDTLALVKNDGYILAQHPAPQPVTLQRSFAFRDYFRGARYLAENKLAGAYVARAFRTETQGDLAFAFSAPVLDQRGGAVGVLMATLKAKSVFGSVKMEDSAGGRHITSALVGPRGPDRGTPPGALARSAFTFLVHPGLPDGTEYAVASPFSSQLQSAFGASAPPGQQFALRYVPPVKIADYRDAVPGFDGRWLAAFAPVGNTGFVVLVQTRHDAWLNWH